MKYFPLIWASLWRKKTRTIFTLLSIVIAFLLYGVLETVDYAFENPNTGVTGADKLITTNKYLPHAAAAVLRRASRSAACPAWRRSHGSPGSAAYYQESKNFVFALPIDTDTYFNLHKNEFIVSADQMTAFRNDRAGRDRERRAHEEIRLENRRQDSRCIRPSGRRRRTARSNWTFDIVGTFDAKDPTQASQQSSSVLFHYELFDEGRSFGKGQVGWFEERIDEPAQSAAISAKIDALFANSPNETKTQPAKDFAIAFIKQLGDVGFVLRAILGAVFFTLLFLTGNTMMQSVRERVPELAVLKTIGFTRRRGAGPRDRRIAPALRAGRRSSAWR